MFLTRTQLSLRDDIRAHLPDPLPARLGVAVSGGSDSTALMHLLRGITQAEGTQLFAAAVDHGLRAGSAAEAAQVAELALFWGVPHETLHWHGWDGSGNLQDQARKARYDLLIDWAKRLQLGGIALGHTADDQAETVLMRLSRAAGVTGLSAMAPVRRQANIDLLRPMLTISRARLRDYLTQVGVGWIEDPSNQDTRFDRIKARNALSQLGESGITAETLSRVAENLAQAREALALFARQSADRCTREIGGAICVDRSGLGALPQEIRRRILIAAVGWIAGDGYPPRQRTIEQALTASAAGQTTTIGGCILVPKGNFTWICRELNAISEQPMQSGQPWDNRWILRGPDMQTAEIRALGEAGMAQLQDWRALDRPRAALLSSPAVWSGDQLLSAPVSGWSNGWSAEIAPDWPDFRGLILSH